jgi:DNA modification methylase
MTHLLNANALHIPLADKSVHCCVTSPPYWSLRDYGTATWVGGDPNCDHSSAKMKSRYDYSLASSPIQDGKRTGTDAPRWRNECPDCGAIKIDHQLGLEPTPEEYVANMVQVFREVWRVLRDDGTLWLNLGDSLNNKQLVGIPWRVAFALQADGWYLRSDIIWAKPNPMPESVRDRPTKAHEYMFLLSKSKRYYYDQDAVREPVAESTANDYRLGWYEAGRPERDYPGQAQHGAGLLQPHPSGRNLRTVWNIATQPFSTSKQTAHFHHVGVDEVSDGMMHIVLPSCPVHGEMFVPLAREFCDEHEDDYWNRIERICNRLFLKPFSDYAPTPQQHALGYEEQSSGYFPRKYSPTAIDHSNESHRMALDLDSNPSYIPFFETVSRIDDKRELLSSFVQHLCIYGNSILKGDFDAHLLPRIPHRIVDKSLLDNFSLPSSTSCECLFYEYYTRKTDHFATFPTKLVEPCIKAGTSEHGVCPICGAPWERQKGNATGGTIGKSWHPHDNDDERGNFKTGSSKNYQPAPTLGWRPTCEHDEEPVPATVLDPFGGSGTTLMVARELDRNSVGLDLSADYLQLARERLGLTALDEWINGQEEQEANLTGLPMFEGEI